MTWAPVDRVAVQDNLLPCCQQQAVSRLCVNDGAFTRAGAAPEERLRRALEIVGVGLLSEAAEKHPEAAFTAWMGRKHKSHPYRSQVRGAGPAWITGSAHPLEHLSAVKPACHGTFMRRV